MVFLRLRQIKRFVLTRMISPWTVLTVLGYTLFCCRARRKRLEHERSVDTKTIVSLRTSLVELAEADKSSVHRQQNLSWVKIMQNRLNKQSREKLVNRLSYKPWQTWRKAKIFFCCLTRGSEIGNWKWNPSATMLAGLMNRSDADGIWRLRNF